MRINYKSNIPFEIRWDFEEYDYCESPYMKFVNNNEFENYEMLFSKLKSIHYNFLDNDLGEVLTEIEGMVIENKETNSILNDEIIFNEIQFYFHSFETIKFEFKLDFLEFFKEDEFLDVINKYHKTNIGYKRKFYEKLGNNTINKNQRKKLKRTN